MKNKLNSCPFCGSSEVSLHKGGDWADGCVYWVECDACESCGPTTDLSKDTKFLEKKASKLWNARASIKAQNK